MNKDKIKKTIHQPIIDRPTNKYPGTPDGVAVLQ